MGRGKPVEIAGHTFTTLGEFKKYVGKLLDDLPLGGVVPEPHHSFLLQLVQRHARASDKIGAGIAHFKVLTNTFYGGSTRCFHLFRVDGTHSDFSYVKCISTPTPWEEFTDALRSAVMDQIIAVREAAFGSSEVILCPIKNISMSRNVTHLDHVAPYTFEALVKQFMDEEWLHEENPPATVGGDNKIGRRLADKEMEDRWRYFHATHAKLRVISKEAHMEATYGQKT